jgi:Ca-activated chloride channel family protein
MEIVGEVQKHPKARVFAFGIGTAVNRFLLDKMAEAGRGAVEYVTLADKAEEAADRFYERVRSPLLTDLYVDWGGLPVADVYPQRLPDLFSGQPVVITGRYTQPASGTVRLKGTRAGGPFSREIPVTFSAGTPPFEALAGFWARRRIDDLMSQDWLGLQQGTMKPEIKEQITQLGLDYRLMTQFTSFVAVEDRIVTKDGKPQRVEVPVEMPEGVSHEGVFGNDKKEMFASRVSSTLGLNGRAVGGFMMRAPAASNQTVEVTGQAAQVNTVNGEAPGPPPPAVAVPKAKHAETRADAVVPSKQRQVLESKLQPAVLAALDCFRKAADSGASCAGVHSGKVTLQVWLAEDSKAARAELQALGFGLMKDGTGQMVTGILQVEKLEELARLSFVKFVSFERR